MEAEKRMSKFDRFIEKVRWVYKIFGSRSYMIITDRGAVCCIPYFNIEEMGSMDHVLLLTAQRESLVNFREQIEELINQHDEVTKIMVQRNRRKHSKAKSVKR